MISLSVVIILIVCLVAIVEIVCVIALRNSHQYDLPHIMAAVAGFGLAFMFFAMLAMASGHH